MDILHVLGNWNCCSHCSCLLSKCQKKVSAEHHCSGNLHPGWRSHARQHLRQIWCRSCPHRCWCHSLCHPGPHYLRLPNQVWLHWLWSYSVCFAFHPDDCQFHLPDSVPIHTNKSEVGWNKIIISNDLLYIHVHSRYSMIGFGVAGAIIFSLYLIYDTQLLIGGKHKYSISPEEYIFAALSIYLDITRIFMFVLMIAQGARRWEVIIWCVEVVTSP